MSGSSLTAADAARRLGQLLTGSEARDLADRLADGDTLSLALKAIAVSRRRPARRLIEACGTAEHRVTLLRALEGARSTINAIDPIWTMPGHLAQGGPLTSRVAHLVDNARFSVTCSTFNFQRSSSLWGALHRAAHRPGVTVRIYVDRQAADLKPQAWCPTTSQVANHMHPGAVLRTKDFDGTAARNHAKFVTIDHRFLLVTSANFSWSAEHGNVELGVLLDHPNLAEAVEDELHRVEDALYERVLPATP
jgi:phosphatidylserine/phosphatidylglycerophosphate/cardiolipin synthase-like enzyme